jgi:ketosteroid isomerase-like protein
LPAFAQQQDTADPEITQKIRTISKGYDEATNNNNAAAVAALYTEDAVYATRHRAYHGRRAVEKVAEGLLFR